MRRGVKEWSDLALDALAEPALMKIQGWLVVFIGAFAIATVPLFWKQLIRKAFGSKGHDFAKALVPEIDSDEDREIHDIAIERMDWVMRKLRMIEALE